MRRILVRGAAHTSSSRLEHDHFADGREKPDDQRDASGEFHRTPEQAEGGEDQEAGPDDGPAVHDDEERPGHGQEELERRTEDQDEEAGQPFAKRNGFLTGGAEGGRAVLPCVLTMGRAVLEDRGHPLAARRAPCRGAGDDGPAVRTVTFRHILLLPLFR